MSQLFTLNWDILKAAELVGHLPEHMPTPKPLLQRIYSGTGMRLMDSPRPRRWVVTITTTARADNGEIHTHTMRFEPSDKVMLANLINGVKTAWIDDCDVELKDMDAVSALAVARCRV